MDNLTGFKKLHSKLIPDYFLGVWVSDDDNWNIETALRGGGFHVVPRHMKTMDGFFNIPTLKEAYELYLKYCI